MALDKSTNMDEIFDIDGYQYIIERDFLEKAKPIKIDFQGQGFKLDSAIKIEGGCAGCGEDGKPSSCG